MYDGMYSMNVDATAYLKLEEGLQTRIGSISQLKETQRITALTDQRLLQLPKP